MASRAGTNRAPAILIVVGSTVDIEIRDVGDDAVIANVKRSVRDGVGHLAGKWQVRLAASGDFGQWDLRLRGAFGRHVASFRSTPEDLADSVARRLRAFLHGVVPPLGTARRPTLVVRRSHAPSAPQPRLRNSEFGIRNWEWRTKQRRGPGTEKGFHER
jgi:hypothetical protein